MTQINYFNANRFFLLNIKPLYKEKSSANYWARLEQLPLFCQVSFDAKLAQEIQSCRELLVTHGLSSISKRCENVSCFFEITERFHPEVSIALHVTEQFLYFTGFIHPYKTPYFQSVNIPISVAIDSARQFRRVELPQKNQQDQSALIRLIETKTEQLNLLGDAINGLDELKTQLEKVNTAGIDLSITEFMDYQEKVQRNIGCKELQANELLEHKRPSC